MQIQNIIDGHSIDPIDNRWIDVFEPANGKFYATLANSNEADVNKAVEAAESAFEEWSNFTIAKRSEILMNIAHAIESQLDSLAAAESKDNGKPLSLAAKVDIPRAADNFRFFAHAITQFASESHESIGLKTINYTLRHPIGIVGCISPWNLPLYLFTWKIAPALAAGNCVIAKPSEITPMTAFLLGKICLESGLPKGVLNILNGLGSSVGQAIVSHPKIKAISFTGGTQTGAQIAATAAPKFKKLSLELGGKNPNLIFEDCDYDKMLNTTLRSSFSNQGQICLCGSRIFVERSIYNKFKTDFVNAVKSLNVGHPSDPQTDIGALVSDSHLQKVKRYIDMAPSEGGKILCGGDIKIISGFEEGYYLNPCVIEIDNNACRLNQEEIFGPVVTLMPFDSEKEALDLANSVSYGLSASVWTNNLNRSMRLSEKLESGIVWVNTWMQRDLRTPFGGTKDSGVGREGGFEALRFFTEPKNICINYSD